jgi:hypothetical protein
VRERALGGRAQAHDHARPNRVELREEPRAARLELGGVGLLVDPLLPARLELEVLDRVGQVDVLARQARLRQGLVEDAAGWADEGETLQVLAIAGLLADEKDRGPRRSAAEDGLGGRAVERAAATPARRALQDAQVAGRRDERGGVVSRRRRPPARRDL